MFTKFIKITGGNNEDRFTKNHDDNVRTRL